jgi:ribosomal protein L6P/L9E
LLWYGKHKISNFKTVYKRHNYNCNVFTRTLAFSVSRNGSITKNTSPLYIPSGWDFLILKPIKGFLDRFLIYLYNGVYFFKITWPTFYLTWFFDNQTNVLTFYNNYLSSFFKLYFKLLTNLFYSFSKLFFTKLKFKGKGYYIYKNHRNTITYQFGYSHRWYIRAFFSTVRFLNKKTVFVFGTSKKDVFSVSQSIRQAKFVNIFTGRGVRFARQIVYKKTGKVSTYR